MSARLTRALVPSEHVEQRVLVQWAHHAEGRHPELGLLYAVPNGGLRSKATAGKLRAEGVRAGVPDVVLPVARGGWFGLFIEMKRADGTGSDVSDGQRAWHTRLREQGYLVVVCKGWERARAVIEAYLTHPPTAPAPAPVLMAPVFEDDL